MTQPWTRDVGAQRHDEGLPACAILHKPLRFHPATGNVITVIKSGRRHSPSPKLRRRQIADGLRALAIDSEQTGFPPSGLFVKWPSRCPPYGSATFAFRHGSVSQAIG